MNEAGAYCVSHWPAALAGAASRAEGGRVTVTKAIPAWTCSLADRDTGTSLCAEPAVYRLSFFSAARSEVQAHTIEKATKIL